MKVLLIEDNPAMQTTLQRSFERRGMQVVLCGDGARALDRWRASVPDVVLLDLSLPGRDGLAVLADARAEGLSTPVLILTARGTVGDRILGLNTGADDYLPKPFEPRELLARVKALLRRAAPEPAGDEVLSFGRLEVDLGARHARLDGMVCDLTSHQFDLLVVLAQSPGRVLSRDQIMDALKGHPLEAFDRSIDVHISRIRAVIEDDPKAPKRVLTVRGAGYVFARKQDAET
jgi:two-component system phosphate regulon response regulator OmpR